MSFFYKRPIKFDGTKEIKTKIRNQTDNVISRRFKILMVSVGVVGLVMITTLFITQIRKQEYYSSKLEQYNTSVFSADTFRGNIYDRNYNRLVYNKNINCATYYAVKGIKESERALIAKFLVENINVDIKDVNTREKKDYLIMKDEDYVNSLLSEEEKKGDPTTVYNYQLSHITDDILKEKLTDEDVKYYMLLSKLQNCTNGSVVLLEGLSIKEASLIGENSSLLRGVKVTNDWVREYTYGDNFKQVLGKVTTKKQGLPATSKDYLLAAGYNNDSRVGTSGLEQQYESLLSGTPATYSLTYDASGNPTINTISEGSSGQDIRLTIDWELQEELGKEVSFDVNFRSDIFKNERQAVDAYKKIIEYADIVKFSSEEAEIFGKDILTAFPKKLVLLTLGKDGSKWFFEGKSSSVPTADISPVDTTGAGDAFFAAVLSKLDGISKSTWSDEFLNDALLFGNCAGALNTLGKGAIDFLPSLRQIEELKKTVKKN